jgi:hypothetical protein
MPIADILRRAADIIGEGWSSTTPLDALDQPIPLYGGTLGDTARAGLNPDIRKHTLYSAIVKAYHEAPETADMPTMWTLLSGAIVRGGYVEGGKNHLHPVHGHNGADGQTVEGVQKTLHDLADILVQPVGLQVGVAGETPKGVAVDDRLPQVRL